MGATFADVATGGPLLLAVLGSAAAGRVSVLSPGVLRLVPGYLSYVTGLAGADLENRRKGRILAGTLLFVAGFAAVFITASILAARLGRALLVHQRTVEVVVGSLIIVLGLAFLGLVPGLQRELRIHKLPAAGLLGAPVFGAVFALSWVPCTGPTLGAVYGLAAVSGSTSRAVLLAVAYCLGLGLPFVAFGLGFRRMLGLFRAVRRNSRWVMRVGGVMLILVGLALVSGLWLDFTIWLKTAVGVGEVLV